MTRSWGTAKGSRTNVPRAPPNSTAMVNSLFRSTLVAANEKSAMEATQAIEKFNRENEELIREVEAEKPLIARNLRFSIAYASLRKKLLAYNAELPLALASDLNEKTLKFYNEVNKNDHPSDRLKSLKLPTAAGERIEIEFENGDKCDALQVLSEGHIRCLGLAILLAKITRDRLPFLIFDDVVNSIDDEHRGAIIDLILNPEEVGKRQLIVTTHGEDFVKRLENAVPMKKYKEPHQCSCLDERLGRCGLLRLVCAGQKTGNQS
ncbi:MAG: hypothetical protein DI599_21560 [Pseudomonas kuykendallii]|uniref:ATPase AAA-type core domain-containing protein n=2 Tax=Pseudomonas kuykendallii TaxID=1007099 RepID=A0A2W5EPF9_9PSED|nr:MAG: hypothetical protein DI599_21560 [Pseudomonas kuykendallii]